MQIRYVGPHDSVEVPGVGLVANGATVTVSAGLAGREPDARLAVAHAELAAAIAAIDHLAAVRLREEIVGLDPGVGLLAQSDAWQPVKAQKSPAPAASEEPQP